MHISVYHDGKNSTQNIYTGNNRIITITTNIVDNRLEITASARNENTGDYTSVALSSAGDNLMINEVQDMDGVNRIRLSNLRQEMV